jgi:hypothetical protein
MPEFDFKDPMVRDYRGREDECWRDIVELDKVDILNSEYFLANCWQVSWGTAMEIHLAWEWGTRGQSVHGGPHTVILVIPEGVRISPWLRYHSDHICTSLSEAQALLRRLEPHPRTPQVFDQDEAGEVFSTGNF